MNAQKCFKYSVGAAVLLLALNLHAGGFDPARAKEIAAMLSPTPAAFGQPITNRTAWEGVAATNPVLKSVVQRAIKLAAQPDPTLPDELYLDCSRTGNRDRAQNVMYERSARLDAFALAECVENKGRFLEPLEKTIAAICSERAWPYPAHDLNLDVFQGRAMKPDLRATTVAFELATADYLLGDRLPIATRELIHENVRKRVLIPVRETIEGRTHQAHWLGLSNNWNAVCLAGTVGAALAIEPSPEDRAFYIAAAEHYIMTFLRGFGRDGYCYEGIGYWNYGFGRFVVLTEEIRQATGGKVDLFKLPEANLPAQAASRCEIINDVYPSIADANPGIKPDPQILRYVDERLHLEDKPDSEYHMGIDRRNLAEAVFQLFAPRPWPLAKDGARAEDSSLRTWFGDSGILIARPIRGKGPQFAIAIKGGNNGETHAHNDSGSFSVVVGDKMVICDPGAEVYTRRTFSSHRYESGVLNSFGHAVPIVAGQLEIPGKAARAIVIQTNFSDAEDVLKFDLSPAYRVPDLKKLERTFVYQRGAAASLRVNDLVEFAKPEKFESALITWGEWKTISPQEFEINDDGARVRLTVDTGGIPFTVRKTMIDEHVHTARQPWHIGIILDKAVMGATVSVLITPINAI
jgi:hypothetical protein